MADRPFPWADAMRFGLGVLRLAPADFWAMTPRELAAAMGALGGSSQPPPDRYVLDRLLNEFPDRQDNAHG
ncbi:MAG: rcc01693 family protein [Roseitalea porphyridii]|uniref:rcc01693 family protein n=1 Tax=Roseitalea porphyridii TaxID=1852022 RepID=UPI0032D93EAF